MDSAEEGGNALAGDYRDLLLASAEGRLSEDPYRGYWARQKAFWVQEAAEIGVREAQEAVGRSGEAGSEPVRD